MFDMSERWTVEEAVREAIRIEEEAIELYRDALDRLVKPSSKKLLRYIIDMKNNHTKFFREALESSEDLIAYCSIPMDVPDYKITDELVKGELSEDSDIQQILIHAAKQEQRTHDFYKQLSQEHEESDIGFMWDCFAREALLHKEILEKEYDRHILQEF
jgi:rubrerythrin